MEDFEYVMRRIKWKGRRTDPTVVRVDGRRVCELCKRPFSDHPASVLYPYPTFVDLCDGRIGKG